jgi:hypothetical protein
MRNDAAPPRSWRRGRSLRHAKLRLAGPQRRAGAGRAIPAPNDATLAHLKGVLNFPRPRPKRLPFVEDGLKTRLRATVQDGLKTRILAPIEGVDSLLQQLMRPLGDDRWGHPPAPLARPSNRTVNLLVLVLEDRRATRREPLP